MKFFSILLAAVVMNSADFSLAAPPSATGHVILPTEGTIQFHPTQEEQDIPPQFQLQDHKFPFQSTFVRDSGPVKVFLVTFPSPVKTEVEENNTVYAKYFQPPGQGPFPGVVVLHILGGDFTLSETIANGLARRGIAALFVKMPYYGERRSRTSPRRMIMLDLDKTVEGMTQAVLDIRRSAAWLAQRPEVDDSQLGITGISLGGIMTALAGAIEPRFQKIAVYLGGGNLVNMFWNHPNEEAQAFREDWAAAGGTLESLMKQFESVDPITYADRLAKRKVLIVAAKNDEIILPQATKDLFLKSGQTATLVWLNSGHITAARYLYGELERLCKFFQPSDATPNAKSSASGSSPSNPSVE